MTRKSYIGCSISLDSKLDIQTNLKTTDYLDMKLNLYKGIVTQFRKNNQYPCYIHIGFNNPKQIFKHIPKWIMLRLSINYFNNMIMRWC